ncbi:MULTISPECIES: DUF6343 family protein [unclassified Streptomyces]|uniref:DUF6343 family protein n=1 Tax=unclassified Streptomyces TaxID=2593676 RepID=UPI00099E493C|nr:MULTISPECIES: DUF6343 family protein [unclassified Streptomyces]
MRTGSEPTTARSPLRIRFWLCVWGVAWAVFGAVAFAIAGRPGWAAACGVLWLVITFDMIMVVRHIRQGPHYQPGRDVPPYAPYEGPGRPPARPHGPGPRDPHGPPPPRHEKP